MPPPPPPPPEQEVIRCAFVVNCAGLRSDAVAGLIGDRSFTIKPRLGEYVLLAKLYLDGRLKLDELISVRLPLERVNEGFDMMRRGEIVRAVMPLAA